MKILLSILLIFTFSCSKPIEENNLVREPVKVPETFDTYWDEVATILAGLPISDNNRFIHLTKTPQYKNFAKKIDSYWESANQKYFKEILEFRNVNITNNSPTNTALYPLSGADFINLYHFNPDSPRYIMIGLQKPGHVNNFFDIKQNELHSVFPNIESLVYELTFLNYYTSKRLERDSKNKIISGVAPILMVFIKRFGFTIVNFQQIYLNREGEVVPKDTQEYDTKEEIPGIRIQFKKNNDMVLRELFFFKIYLTGKSGNEVTSEGKFLKSQNRFNLVFKSAEYILQLEEYKPFLDTILAKTDRVIEDESGIPVNYFSKDFWDIKVFGQYIGRIKLKNTPNVSRQHDLDELFKDQSPQLLNFPFGYGILKGKNKSNLIFVQRK
jgi:hypothetical protein